MERTILTFRAATMDDAMDLVRRELGHDAVVVESKEVATRRILPWFLSRQEIEVSAERSAQQTNTSASSKNQQTPSTPGRTVRTLAEVQSLPVSPAQDLMTPVLPLPTDDADLPWLVGFPPTMPTADEKSVETSFPSQSETSIQSPADADLIEYRKTLETVQTLLTQLQQKSTVGKSTVLPNEFASPYRQLIDADVDEAIARQLIDKLGRHFSANPTIPPASVTAVLTALIEREMRCAPPIQPKMGRREIVTLIGPTGVGKTTTLAKLAGQFQLRDGLRVGLITVDAYRVGAVDQLQTYAEILQVPLKTADNVTELQTAIDELDDVDVILIDTAGRSPQDGAKMAELRDMVRVSGSNHVLLVLSMASSAKMLARISDQFAPASPTSLVLTKLDETPVAGGLLSVARDIPHAVSYVTTGQDVPDQIEAAHPSRLARLILGSDKILREARQST